MKIVINDPKTGKSYSLEKDIELFLNRRIGDIIDGALIGLEGFELEITGGSDTSGFPMRKGLRTANKIKIISAKGVGFRSLKKGEKRRKTVRGEIISSEIAQLNLKIVKYANKNLEELLKNKDNTSQS